MDLVKGDSPVTDLTHAGGLERVLRLGFGIALLVPMFLASGLRLALGIGGTSVFELLGWSGSRGKNLVKHGVSKTAMMVAVARHWGTMTNLIDDPMAEYFIPREVAWYLRWTPLFKKRNAMTFLVARTILGDRLILNAKPKQVILLGAGLDTRAHRLEVQTKFFEIDLANTQAWKKKIASANPNLFKGKVEYIPVDFSTESFIDKLRLNLEFDSNTSSTVILFEGVSMYLPWKDVKSTLEMIAKSFPKGTIVGMDVIDDMFSSTEAILRQKDFSGSREAVDMVNRVGEPYQWGLPAGHLPNEFFEPLGFQVTHFSPQDMERLFLTAPNATAPFKKMNIGYFHYIVLRVL